MRRNPHTVAVMVASTSITRRRTGAGGLVLAARDAAAVWSGLCALGIGLGVLVTNHGLPWWLAPILSGTVYAGSVEFLLVGLLAAAAPISTIAVTTLLVNSRHVFYGLSFPLHRIRRWGRPYAVYALSDEAYVLVTRHRPEELSSGRILWTQAGLHLSWVSGSVIGAVAGASWLPDLTGVDFVLTALFIVLAIDAYRGRPDMPGLVAAAGAGVVAATLAGGAMLLVAMAAFVAFCLARHARSLRPHGPTRSRSGAHRGG